MAEDGSVLIKILGDASEFEKSLNGIAGKGASLIGKGFAAAEGAIVAAGAASVKVGADFESSMSQVAATMGMTTEEIRGGSKDFETLKNAAQQAGETTAFSATESAQALNYLALAGYDAGKAAEVLPSVLNLAAAGGMDLAYASDLVTDSMSALGIEATKSNVDEFGDKMAKTASKANTSVAQLGEATLTVGGTAKDLAGGVTELNTVLGILADNGIKGSEGGTALRNMILSLEAPTDKAAGQLEELGVQVFDSTGKMRSMQDIMADLNKAMANMTSGERTQALNTIFNKVDLKSVNALLGTSTERWNELAGAIDNSTGAMQAMADVQLDNLEGDVTLLQSALEGLGIAVYDHLNEPLRDAVQTITEVVGDMTKAVKGGDFDELFEGISDAIQSIVKLIQKASKVFMKIAPTAVKVIGLIADGVSELLDHVELVTGAVVGLGGAIAAMRIASIVPQITGIIKTLMAGVQTLRVVGLGINGVCGAMEVMGVSLTACTGGLGAIAIAAAGAVAAIAAFAVATADSSKKTDENAEATKELIEEHQKLTEKVNENRHAREENINSAKAEGEQVDIYATKLEELMGVEKKSKSQKKLILKYVDLLNDSVDDLNLKYDEEKDSLNKSTDAIKANIDARKEQLKAEALQENLKEIAGEMAELEIERNDLLDQRQKNEDAYYQAQKERIELEKKLSSNGRERTQSEEEALLSALSKEEQKKKLLDETTQALGECNEELSKSAQEYGKVEDAVESAFNQVDIESAFSDLVEMAKEAGVTIPTSISDGIREGRYTVPQSIDELKKLVTFDAEIQKYKLQGVEIPESLAQGVYSGEISVKDAIQRLKDVVKFDDLARKLNMDGSDSTNSLRDGLISGELSLKEASNQLKNTVEKNAKPDIAPKAKVSIEEYEKAFYDRHPDIKDAAKELGDSASRGVEESTKPVGNAAKKPTDSFVDTFNNNKKNASKAAGALGSGAFGSLESSTSGIPAMGGQRIVGFVSGMSSRSGSATRTAVTIGKNTKDKLASSSSGTSSIGSNIVSGIISGMASVAKRLYDYASSIVNTVKDKMRSVLDINSPSRVFRDQVGVPISEGVAVGIEQGGEEVNSAAASSVKDAVRAANKEVAKSSIDMSGLIASIPEAKKAISANMSDISMKAKAAVQYEMDRRAASIPAYNILSAPVYDDERIIALLRDLVAETRNGKTIMVNQRVLGQTVRQWDQKMTRITGGA